MFPPSPEPRNDPREPFGILTRPRITKISTPKGRPHYRVVHFDGRSALRVPARLLSELGLRPGDVIAAPLEKELEAAEELDKARARAVRSLGIRLRSEEELRRSLIHANYSHSAIEETLGTLKRDGVLDDMVFSERFAEERHRLRGYAPARIESDLRSRGVAREIAHGAAWGAYGEEDSDIDSCLLDEGMMLLKRKQAHYEGLRPEVARRRMAGLLGRAGYPASVAIDAVDAVVEEMQSQGLLASSHPEDDRTDQ